MLDLDDIATDHEFEPSPFCDCSSCQEMCHWHYGQDDACLGERHQHVKPELEPVAPGSFSAMS